MPSSSEVRYAKPSCPNSLCRASSSATVTRSIRQVELFLKFLCLGLAFSSFFWVLYIARSHMCAAAGPPRSSPGAACWQEAFGIHWWDAMCLRVVFGGRWWPILVGAQELVHILSGAYGIVPAAKQFVGNEVELTHFRV